MSYRIAKTSPYTISSTQQEMLGAAYRQDSTGRVWHYAEAGGSNLDAGKLTVAATVAANHINLSFASAPAVGATDVSVTLGATAAAKDLYKDGMMVVQDGTGEPNLYPIEGHPAADSAGTIYLTLAEAIRTAGATSTTGVDLLKNRYKDIVISVTDQADPVTGVPNVAITADYYGYVQTWGPCSVWMDEAIAAGAALTIGTGTAGQVEMLDAAGEVLIGHMGMTAGVDTEYQLVNLCIER